MPTLEEMEGMTVKEVKALATKFKIKGRSKLRKQDLMEAIAKASSGAPVAPVAPNAELPKDEKACMKNKVPALHALALSMGISLTYPNGKKKTKKVLCDEILKKEESQHSPPVRQSPVRQSPVRHSPPVRQSPVRHSPPVQLMKLLKPKLVDRLKTLIVSAGQEVRGWKHGGKAINKMNKSDLVAAIESLSSQPVRQSPVRHSPPVRQSPVRQSPVRQSVHQSPKKCDKDALMKNTAKKLKEMLESQGVGGKLPSLKAKLVDLLCMVSERGTCDPMDEEKMCRDPTDVCVTEKNVCVPAELKDSFGKDSITINGRLIVGSKKAIAALREKIEPSIGGPGLVIGASPPKKASKKKPSRPSPPARPYEGQPIEENSNPTLETIFDDIKEKHGDSLKDINDIRRQTEICLGLIPS